MSRFGWASVGTIATGFGLVIGVLSFWIPAAEDRREVVYLNWSAQSDQHNSCRAARDNLFQVEDALELQEAQIVQLLAQWDEVNPDGLTEWHLGLMRSYHDLIESRSVFERLRAGFIEAQNSIEAQFGVDFSENDQPLSEWQYNRAYPIFVDILAEHGFSDNSRRDILERIRRWLYGRDNVPSIDLWHFNNPNVNGQTFNHYVPLLDRAISETIEREQEISKYEAFLTIRGIQDLKGAIALYHEELEEVLETEEELNKRLEAERLERAQAQESVARALSELDGLQCGQLPESCRPPGSALRPSLLSAMTWTLRDWAGQEVQPRPICSV